MNHFPQSWDALVAANYAFVARRGCHGCGKTIEFWETPSGRKTPLERSEAGVYSPHFASCPGAEKFRSGGKRWQPKQKQSKQEKPKEATQTSASSGSSSSSSPKPIPVESLQKTLFRI